VVAAYGSGPGNGLVIAYRWPVGSLSFRPTLH